MIILFVQISGIFKTARIDIVLKRLRMNVGASLQTSRTHFVTFEFYKIFYKIFTIEIYFDVHDFIFLIFLIF